MRDHVRFHSGVWEHSFSSVRQTDSTFRFLGGMLSWLLAGEEAEAGSVSCPVSCCCCCECSSCMSSWCWRCSATDTRASMVLMADASPPTPPTEPRTKELVGADTWLSEE